MLLTVQQAARRLGVSPVTVRRWTATGFLPCTRTAGGHRRIDEHDLDDLAQVIGASDHVGAQVAREREVDVLIDTSIALAERLDLGELLQEVAMRMTSLLDCHFCAISAYDPVAEAVITLAEYDDAGRRLPDASPYKLRDFPLTRRVLTEQVTVVVNVDDPEADEAEVAELRREGDRSLLMVPLVVQGDTIGLLEVADQRRARQYSRQELRLAGAVAGQAAVAIKNARLFAERRRSDQDITSLRRGLAELTRRVPEAAGGGRAKLLECGRRRRVRGRRRHLVRGGRRRRDGRRFRPCRRWRPGARRQRPRRSRSIGRHRHHAHGHLARRPGRGRGRPARSCRSTHVCRAEHVTHRALITGSLHSSFAGLFLVILGRRTLHDIE